MNRLTIGLVVLWIILANLVIWRIMTADNWGYAVSIALLAWLGGLVTAVLGEIFLVRNRADW
jgi:hypothetical protein